MSKASDKDKSLKRQRSEEAILDAFERVLIRDGLNKFGVNIIMREAGLAKPLLYDYFGDLHGLAKEWVDRRGIWPGQHEDPSKIEVPEDSSSDPHERIKVLLVSFANALRNNPVALLFLAADLTGNKELGDALNELRQKWTNSLGTGFANAIVPGEIDVERYITIFYPAIVYLALRARQNTAMGTIDLESDEGWDHAINIITSTIDDLATLDRIKKSMET